jgi:hypothetical protein
VGEESSVSVGGRLEGGWHPIKARPAKISIWEFLIFIAAKILCSLNRGHAANSQKSEAVTIINIKIEREFKIFLKKIHNYQIMKSARMSGKLWFKENTNDMIRPQDR